MMCRLGVHAIVAVALVTATVSPAVAQAKLGGEKPANDREAIVLYERGLRHYQLAEFAAAVDAFKASYRLSPDPELLFNIAQSYRRMGLDGCVDALEFYRNYRVATSTPPPELDSRITEMERCVANRPTAEPTPSPPPAPPPVEVADASTTHAPSSERVSRWPELGLAAAGVSGAIVGGWLRGRAASRADELWRLCGSACPEDDVSGIRRDATLGAGLLIAGGLAVVGAGTMWWLRDGKRARTSVAFVPHGAGLMVRGAF
jgi:hypothetical protein